MKTEEIVEYPEMGGYYKHYKGGLYRVITMATHTENDEKLVIYKSIPFGSIHARPIDSWNEKVKGEGEFIERFELIPNRNYPTVI